MLIVKIAAEKLNDCTKNKMKKQLRILLPAILCAGVFWGNAVAANQVAVDTVAAGQQKFDPYFVEALPLGAPRWMQRIATDPAGVNFKEMQRLYNEWRAGDDNVRVRTVDNKQVVNYYRRWMASYRDYVAPDGSIDRRKLAETVFGKPDELKNLTDILYPELNRRMDSEIAMCRNKGLNGAFEIPLLFEQDYAARFDAVLTVWGAAEIRHQRLKDLRHFTDEEIAKRENQQLPSDEKLERADFALINNGSKELLRKQILILTDKIKNWNKK